MTHISILTPTRGRPEHYKEFCSSVLDTASDPDRVLVLGYVDSDDPRSGDYATWFSNIVIGDHVGVGRAWNKLYQSVSWYAEIVGMGNDDLVYKTQGWDEKLVGSVHSVEDRILLTYFDDGINGPLMKSLTHPVTEGAVPFASS